MTLTWILVGFTLLLVALQLRALPRLLPQVFMNKKILLLFGLSSILFLTVLLFYWKLPLIFACFFFATALAFSLFDPVFGFCVYLACLIFRPWELWPTDTIFLILPKAGALWLLGLALLVFIKENRKLILKKSWLLALFFIWVVITSIKSPLVGTSMSNNIQLVIPSFVLCLLTQFWISDRMDYDLVTDSFALSVVVTSILTIILYIGSNGDQGRIETMGILSNSNDIAALCILALPFTLKPLFSPERFKSRIFYPVYLFMSFPLLVVIYFSQSRGALIALATIAGGWIFTQFKMHWYVLVIFLAVSYAGVNFISSKRESEDLQQSTESRISYWIAGTRMAIYNPILGVGMGRYPDEYERYSTTHYYEFGNRTAHSSWVLILAETGFPGLFLFASIFLFALKETYKRRYEYPEVFLSLLGYMVAMSFLSHSYLFYPYLILGICFAVIRLQVLPANEVVE